MSLKNYIDQKKQKYKKPDNFKVISPISSSISVLKKIRNEEDIEFSEKIQSSMGITEYD